MTRTGMVVEVPDAVMKVSGARYRYPAYWSPEGS